MKSLLLFVCLMMLGGALYAQQIAKGITAVSNNDYIGFYEYKPTDYSTEDQSIKHPLIIFLHGGGEMGNGTTDLPKVLANGIPTNIKNGSNMRFFWNGKWETFLVLSPQLKPDYGYWQTFYVEELINYAKQNLRIDTNRIFLTGLSMGGGGTWFYPGSSLQYAQRLAAIGVSCGACQDINFCNIANANLPVWAFHAIDDNSTAPVGCTYSNIAKLNTCNPAVVPYTTYWPTGGHAIWGRVYSTDYSWQNPNLYEWFLGQNKSLPVNKRPIANAGHDATISASLGSVNLSGALSKDLDGKLVRFIWRQVSGPITGSMTTPVSVNGVTTVTGLTTPGTYQFELKAVDDRADWSFAVVNITVVSGSTPNIPPVTSAGPNQNVIYPQADLNGSNSYDPDGTVVAYQWKKIGGPAVYTLSNDKIASPSITNLLVGIYQFELEATDNLGAKTKDTVSINATSFPLPVQLLFFRGSVAGSGTQLVWATENEEGNERYEVEGSYDGSQFQLAGSLQARAHAASQNNYNYTDPHGFGYYRLKMISSFNRVNYSPIIRVERKNARLSLDYFPNPVQHTLSVLIDQDKKGLLKIRLLSLDGKTARQEQWIKQQGLFSTTMDLRSLAPGIYMMEISLGNDWREVRKIIKQ